MIPLIFAIAAQLADAWTWMALPPGSEQNPIPAAWHSETAWAAKILLLVTVLSLAYALPRLRARYRWTPVVARYMADVLVVTALVAGSVGVGSNVAVLG